MRKILNSLVVYASITFLAIFSILPTNASAQYDCGSYGYSNYGDQVDCEGAGGSSGGGLSDTGQALYIFVPALLVLAGSAGLFALSRKSQKQKKKQTNNQ